MSAPEAVSWHALDFVAAVLAGDSAGRDRALAELLRTPREGLLAVGALLLLTAGPETRTEVAHMVAMTSLREAVPE